MQRRGALSVVIVFAALVFALALQALACTSTASEVSASTSGPAVSAADRILQQAVSWIEASPIKVTFGGYTVSYGQRAEIARLTFDAEATTQAVDPLPPMWWSSNTDYWFQQGSDAPRHVTPQMALSMSEQSYGGAQIGMEAIYLVRCIDPHRMLAKAKAVAASASTAGGWNLEVQTSVWDLVGPDLAESLGAPLDTQMVTAKLELGEDGSIRAMTVEYYDSTSGPKAFAWTRTSDSPNLPVTWVDLDTESLQAALKSGWRATPQDAAAAVSFAVYCLGDSYKGLTIQDIKVTKDDAVSIRYGPPRSPILGSTTTTMGPRDLYSLREFSSTNIPEEQQSLVATRTLLKTVTQSGETYTIFETSDVRAILVKRGATYVLVWTSAGAQAQDADVMKLLIGAAEALRLVER